MFAIQELISSLSSYITTSPLQTLFNYEDRKRECQKGLLFMLCLKSAIEEGKSPWPSFLNRLEILLTMPVTLVKFN